jgi:hypothetical protein
MSEASHLTNLVPDLLWEAAHVVHMGPGIALPTRMTVARLEDGGIALHSPVPLGEGLARALRGLGPVRLLIAPNDFHHLYLAAAVAVFPEAAVWEAPGLVRKRPDVRFDGLLGPEASPPWAASLQPFFLAGAPAVSETAFVHRSTRTLILTDALFNLQDGAPGWLSPLLFRLFGTWRRTSQSRLWRRFVKDRAAMRQSLEAVLAADFDRVVMAHGRVIEAGGKAALREAAAWLGLGGGPERGAGET